MSAVVDTPPVFISYARADSALADRVQARLLRDGVESWRDTSSATAGLHQEAQDEALHASTVAIFLVTVASTASDWCFDEAVHATRPNITRPIPIVVGDWDHESSRLWRRLCVWQAIMAKPRLLDEHLDDLARLVRGQIVAPLSTGQALLAVKDDLCAQLVSKPEVATADILATTHELQCKHRGHMVAFSEFAHLDSELPAADLLAPRERGDHVRRYLEEYFDQVVDRGYADVAERLAKHIQPRDTIVVSEYSRVIARAMRILKQSDSSLFGSLRFLVVERTGMLLMADEPKRMLKELRHLKAKTVQIVPFPIWIEYLVNDADGTGIGHVDKLLFGVEAFSECGEIVYPQNVNELEILRARSPNRRAEIIAAGEAFKVCRDNREIVKMYADPHYTVMPPGAVDLIVTDIGEFRPDASGRVDLSPCVRHVRDAVDEIRARLWPPDCPLPIRNLARDIREGVKALVCAIECSVTDGDEFSLDALKRFRELHQAGVKVILITGRSAGWGCALAHYLPGVCAVIAENGAVLVGADGSGSTPILLDRWQPEELSTRMRPVLDCLAEALAHFPRAVPGDDNFTRITDRTIEVSDDVDPEVLAAIAKTRGVRHTYSSVHHHLSASGLDKETGLAAAMAGELDMADLLLTAEVVTVGDSLNDAPLFHREAFAATVGVRGVLKYRDVLGTRMPGYVTLNDASEGFLELADLLLAQRSTSGRREPFARSGRR